MAVAGRRGLPATIMTSAMPSTGGASAHTPAVTTVTATTTAATLVISASAAAVAPGTATPVAPAVITAVTFATVTPVTTAVTTAPALFGIGDGRIEHCMRDVQIGQERHNQHREDCDQQDPRDSPHRASLLGE